MSEKKGNTVKLKYDFPSQRCCEVYIPNLEDLYRVTPKVFRSWCGQRRILHLEEDPRKNIATKAEYKDYNGPTYLYDSNKKINASKHGQHQIAFLHGKDPRQSRPRKYEHFTNS